MQRIKIFAHSLKISFDGITVKLDQQSNYHSVYNHIEIDMIKYIVKCGTKRD